jgi:hypothetical protein
MYRTTKKKLVKRVGISSVVALGALGLGATVASASTTTSAHHTTVSAKDTTANPSPPQGPVCAHGPGGVVTALTSGSITVTDPSGTATTFTISSSTTVTKDRSTASISDLALGDEVRVMPGATDSSTAASIDIVQPSVMGKVSAINGDTITIAGPNSTSATVIVSNATTYTKDGATATLGDVTVGSSIFAEGSFASPTDTSTLEATSVGIGAPRGALNPGGAPNSGGPMLRGAPSGSQRPAA